MEEGKATQATPMPKRIIITPHVSLNELESHYRRASDPIERTRCQIIWLLAKGRSTQDIAAVTGYCPNSICRIARRYNQSGLEGSGFAETDLQPHTPDRTEISSCPST